MPEIERKFLLDKLPDDLDQYPCWRIAQGYIQADQVSEIRLRRRGDQFVFTMKTGKGLSRHEQEFALGSVLFERLWPLTGGRRLEKVRYEMEREGRVWEVDVFKQELQGLRVVEVEFTSEQDAASFSAPDWFGREVTHDERYKNKNLALNGLPDE